MTPEQMKALAPGTRVRHVATGSEIVLTARHDRYEAWEVSLYSWLIPDATGDQWEVAPPTPLPIASPTLLRKGAVVNVQLKLLERTLGDGGWETSLGTVLLDKQAVDRTHVTLVHDGPEPEPVTRIANRTRGSGFWAEVRIENVILREDEVAQLEGFIAGLIHSRRDAARDAAREDRAYSEGVGWQHGR